MLRTFNAVSVAQCVECVLAAGAVGRDIGNHDCARLSHERVTQHLSEL